MATDPHADAPEENPLEHVGAERPDPWDSNEVEDGFWPNEIIEVRTDTPEAAKGVAHVEEV